MNQYSRSSFTLIEMLIVVGILGVLAVALLLTINPGEAQKKTRDTRRMKDLKTIETILNQYIADGFTPTGCLTGAIGCPPLLSSPPIGGQPCDNNWMQNDFCRYVGTVPTDPNSMQQRRIILSGPFDNPSMGTWQVLYRAKVSGSNYEVEVRQEAIGNAKNTVSDGGSNEAWAEAGSDLNLLN